jgi:hypothetical protein
LTIFKNGLCDGENVESDLYLLNCEITVLESVYIQIWQPIGVTKRVVKMAANSAIEDDGKGAVKAVAYEINGAVSAVWSQARPILIDGKPKLTSEPSV